MKLPKFITEQILQPASGSQNFYLNFVRGSVSRGVNLAPSGRLADGVADYGVNVNLNPGTCDCAFNGLGACVLQAGGNNCSQYFAPYCYIKVSPDGETRECKCKCLTQ